MPETLEGVVRHYDWGSLSDIPNLLGRPADGRPWAELWLGAHPAASAAVGSQAEPLDRLIATDPIGSLGPTTASEFGGLPFLMKVLSAARPLSLQVHPPAVKARAGFEREQALGIPINSPRRSFSDPFHKPELVCALTRFEALCGLREPAATLALLDHLDTRAIDCVRDRLRSNPSPDGLRDLIGWLLSLDQAEATTLVEPVVRACSQAATEATASSLGYKRPKLRIDRPLAAAATLGSHYPSDPGVIVALLLNHVVLTPGEAIFLASGSLHCYISGTAVEVMACSDNVLRGGLTNKHVDASTLLDVLDPIPSTAKVQQPSPTEGITTYKAPVAEFALRRIEVEPHRPATVDSGPSVILCTEGRLIASSFTLPEPDKAPPTLSADSSIPANLTTPDSLILDRGQAAWIPFSEPRVRLTGHATVFACSTGTTRPQHPKPVYPR